MKQEDLATAATKLLSRFPEVELTIQPSGTDLVSLIRTVLSVRIDCQELPEPHFSDFP